MAVLLFNESYSQNKNSIWCFGDSAGIDFRNLSNPVPISTGMDGRGGCSSISDSAGNLLFYSFSYVTYQLTKILSADHAVMTNSNLMPGWGLYNDNLILPKPGSNHEYYNFFLGSGGAVDTTYYALVDMNLNGGLGDVVRKNVPIGAYYPADCLTAVKHGNGRDWWLLGKLGSNPFTNFNRFFVYLITPDSVYNPIVQDFGNAKDVAFQKIIWHPNYDRFIVINTRGYMAEFNFDRCSGTISLNRDIFTEQQSNFSRVFFDGAYSANGNVLYVSRNSYAGTSGDNGYLLQFDLTAVDIAASCDTLDSTRYVPFDSGAVRRGPDGKIYYAQPYIPSNAMNYPYADSMYNYINMNLGVVNYPDSLGSACDFRPFSFYLGGKRTYWGLPNNPEYDLGPVVGSACDTINSVVEQTEINPALNLFYQSGWQSVIVNASRLKGAKVKIYLTDIAGRILFVDEGKTIAGYFSKNIPMENFAAGIYLVTIVTEKEKLSRKIVKE